MRRSIMLAAGALLISTSAVRAQAPEPLVIPVMLPLTGQGAFVGKSESEAFALVERLVNREGGVGGRPVKFAISDDTSSPQTAVQLANQFAAQRAPVFIGSSLTAVCNATAALVREKGPVQYCLSPGVRSPGGSFVFSSGLSLEDSAAVAVRYFRERGLGRIAILMGSDATGIEMDRDFDRALARPENAGVQKVAHEHFNLGDVSVAAQVARIKSARPQVLLTWTVGPAFGTLLHAVQDGGLDVPVLASGGDMIYGQLEQVASLMPKELIFVSILPFAHDRLAKGPIRDAQTRYDDAFRAAGIRPDFTHTLAWDPALIVVDAYRHAGANASPEQIRAYLASLHGFAGIDGIYDFRDGSQRGIGENAAIISRWDPQRRAFVTASTRGAHAR